MRSHGRRPGPQFVQLAGEAQFRCVAHAEVKLFLRCILGRMGCVEGAREGCQLRSADLGPREQIGRATCRDRV